jgi:putative nucleotidyltransferase with HDIG domain
VAGGSQRPAGDAVPRVGLLVTAAAAGASVWLALAFPSVAAALRHDPAKIGAFFALTLALQLMSVPVRGRGSISVSGVGVLAAGIALGVGPSMAIALAAALVQWARKRGYVHRAIFDAAQFVLSAGAAAATYHALAGVHDGQLMHVVAAFVAGTLYTVVNNFLLCLAMSLSEEMSIVAIWHERFHWARYHFLTYGPLALAATIADSRVGWAGLVAFALPPGLLIFSVRQYLDHTRTAFAEVRRANDELRHANAALGARNEDLNELFQFAAGLASRAHDQHALLAYVEGVLGRLAGAPAHVSVEDVESGIGLFAGGARIGSLGFPSGTGSVSPRWTRLRETILPQLATALESAQLVERVRKMHLDTIAALSRSMEAKDYYTGNHTERVAQIAVGLAARLGYEGVELDAIQVGALLHDIGKIGIPERILQKPGALNEDEWRVMREHPVISAYILSDVDLHPIVREIARSSHERIDGAGYPDGLGGDDVPLPARIVLVADAFDSLTSNRPYRRARHPRLALEELRRHAGTQFCAEVVEALELLYREEPHVLGLRPSLRVVQVAG